MLSWHGQGKILPLPFDTYITSVSLGSFPQVKLVFVFLHACVVSRAVFGFNEIE